MKNETRAKFNAMITQIAQLNGIDADVARTSKFTVEPSVQQKLEQRMQDSSDFLSRINIEPVDEIMGELLGLGVGSTIAGRTDTANGNRRKGIDPIAMDDRTYTCAQTNFDVAMRYAKIDKWAKFKDFETKWRDNNLKRQALDRILIGFNGTSAAAATDRVANPLLQDVNIGWLEKMRTENEARVLSEVVAASGKVTYGAGGDYETLDALVWDAKESMLAEWAKNDTELVVIVSVDLLHDKYFPMINQSEAPTEELARDVIMSTKRLGGLPAYRVPGFPNGTVFITRFDNLSLYYQDGKRRRLLKDEPELDQVTDYQSSNESYVIEDLEYACLVENIEEYVAP
ncbi:phage major capsid protein, P2 family [Novosphingobium pentaromativorans]|uniref:Major capsid protein n=1 Tax=Novosphingobium pentaromativorans US6-1 TaxID=1088721 RepID=G6EFJ5_9SPHN|nr:phage major capsid protein, P2 family [Novosphingobium pentaromativorans]AIT79094.1 capsid protein [Novosphingobium pentaromativorans US6-1]EHJ59943.1 major capsid protein precursor [Novosphingobium pentaromativorans US6-1]